MRRLVTRLSQWSYACRGAGEVLSRETHETSSGEYQIRSHRSGAIGLKAVEQHITAEQDDRQQTVHKIRSLSRSLIAHFAGFQY
jgi:hypothetical protein